MGKKDKKHKKRKHKDKKHKKKDSRYTAATADRHVLYELAVQNVEHEIEFLDETYRQVRGRNAQTLREDFAGTCAAAVEWVKSGAERQAWCVDIDSDVLEWGRGHHIGPLAESQRQRIEQIEGDVLDINTPLADIIIGFNFSFFTFNTRDAMRKYFEKARRNLKPDGLFFLDCFGGSEAYDEIEEETELEGFTYIWDQDTYDPVSGHMQCYIHFEFPDGTALRPAFEYSWRLWSLPELRELLVEAGFRKSTVYWEGTDEDGEGNGEFRPAERGEADPGWIAYIVSER